MAIGEVTQMGVWVLLHTNIFGSGHPWRQIDWTSHNSAVTNCGIWKRMESPDCVVFPLYFIDYTYICPAFSSFVTLHKAPPLSQAIPERLFLSTGDAYKFFGYSISYTVLYIPMVILELPICTSFFFFQFFLYFLSIFY